MFEIVNLQSISDVIQHSICYIEKYFRTHIVLQLSKELHGNAYGNNVSRLCESSFEFEALRLG